MTNDKTVSPRRRRNRERMMKEILDTSREIMRENGAAALSMHELARRMGVQPPSLYHYFSGLMDLYDALFRMGFEQWGAYFTEYTRKAQTWQDTIRLSMEAYLTFATQHPEMYQLCFERPVPGFTPAEESLQVSLNILEEVYTQIAGLQDSLNTDLPPQQLADLIIAITHGLTALHLANQPELPPGQGRFGSLIPAAVAVLDKAWAKS